jgi:hypothetical protein
MPSPQRPVSMATMTTLHLDLLLEIDHDVLVGTVTTAEQTFPFTGLLDLVSVLERLRSALPPDPDAS